MYFWTLTTKKFVQKNNNKKTNKKNQKKKTKKKTKKKKQKKKKQKKKKKKKKKPSPPTPRKKKNKQKKKKTKKKQKKKQKKTNICFIYYILITVTACLKLIMLAFNYSNRFCTSTTSSLASWPSQCSTSGVVLLFSMRIIENAPLCHYLFIIYYLFISKFLSQKKKLTFSNCTGFLNFTRIRTSRDIVDPEKTPKSF